MKKDIISDSISVLTGGFAIANIEEILSIIILVISLLNILINLCVRIYNNIKNKKYGEISKDIEDAEDKLRYLQEEIKKKEKGE